MDETPGAGARAALPAGAPPRAEPQRAALQVAALLCALLPAVVEARPAPPAGLPDGLRCAPPTRPTSFVQDPATGRILSAADADRPLPAASLAKLMTLQVALNAVAAGEVRLGDVAVVRAGLPAEWRGRGASAGLAPGQRVTIAGLMALAGGRSANDAAAALAEAVAGTQPAFVARMEAERVRLGLAGSRFETVAGWFDGGRTCISARDAARLLGAVVDAHGPLALRFLGAGALAADAPGRPLAEATGAVALKTGWTAAAGRGVALDARRGARRLLVATLGHPSDAARLAAARALVEAGFAGPPPAGAPRR